MIIALVHLPNLKASRSFFQKRGWGWGGWESPSSEMEEAPHQGSKREMET